MVSGPIRFRCHQWADARPTVLADIARPGAAGGHLIAIHIAPEAYVDHIEDGPVRTAG